MYRLISWIAILTSLLACSKKITTTNTSTNVLDSTFMSETVHYDTVFVAGDTIILKEWVECDSVTNKPKPFRAKGKSGRASVKVEVTSKGTLKVEGVCDSLQRVIESKDREITHLRKETTDKKTTIVKQPSGLQIWFDWTCRILAGLLVALVVLRLGGWVRL